MSLAGNVHRPNKRDPFLIMVRTMQKGIHHTLCEFLSHGFITFLPLLISRMVCYFLLRLIACAG